MEDIKYNYIDELKNIDTYIDENPFDTDICKKMACLHPQMAYHIDALKSPCELSMEFTLPANKINSKIKLYKLYIIDVSILIENGNKDFNNFVPMNAIISELNIK